MGSDLLSFRNSRSCIHAGRGLDDPREPVHGFQPYTSTLLPQMYLGPRRKCRPAIHNWGATSGRDRGGRWLQLLEEQAPETGSAPCPPSGTDQEQEEGTVEKVAQSRMRSCPHDPPGYHLHQWSFKHFTFQDPSIIFLNLDFLSDSRPRCH